MLPTIIIILTIIIMLTGSEGSMILTIPWDITIPGIGILIGTVPDGVSASVMVIHSGIMDSPMDIRIIPTIILLIIGAAHIITVGITTGTTLITEVHTGMDTMMVIMPITGLCTMDREEP